MKTPFKNYRRSFLPVSGILLLFCFQQFILYYSLYYLKNVKTVLYSLILDVPLGVYILFGLVVLSSASSVRYSILWCMYSLTIVIKMILLAFLDQPSDSAGNIEGLSSESNDLLLSFFGLYVTPIVFSLFNNASKSALFQDKNNVSVDELLHSDLGLSTTIDLWDLILMFSHLLKYYKVEVKDGKSAILNVRLFVTFIVFVLITIFLLGLVIPTVDGDYKVEDKFKTNIFNEAIRFFANIGKLFSRRKSLEAKRGSQALRDTTSLTSIDEGASSSLDMFTMAKFTFIIGFFLVDIPFLCYRLYILIKYNVFSLLMYKNFIFLFLRPYRLNMSQLAERDTAKGWQAAFFNTNLLNTHGEHKTNSHFDAFEDSAAESDNELLKRFSRKMSIRKKKSRIYKSALGPKLMSRLSFSQQRRFAKSDPMHLPSSTFGSTEFPKIGDDFEGEGDDEPGSREYLEYLNQELEHVDGHNYKMYVLKILKKSKMLPIRSFPLTIIMKQWSKFLFGPFRNFESALVSDLSGFNPEKFNEFAFLIMFLCTITPRVALVFIFYLEDIRSPREIIHNLAREASFMEKFIFELSFAFSFILVIFSLYTCRLFDSFFSFARDLLNLYSLMICLHSFKSVLQDHCLPLLFLVLAYPVLIALSLANNFIPQRPDDSDPFTNTYVEGAIDDAIDRRNRRRQISNLKLVYVLLKYSIGPITLNQKLCTLDLVETFKIHDSLLCSQWSQFIYSLLFKLLCSCSLESKSSILVLFLDLLFSFIYIVMGQSVRSLLLRKYEVNYIVMRMLKLLRFEWDYSFDRSEDSVTLADVDKYIKLQGLISSPGAILPPF